MIACILKTVLLRVNKHQHSWPIWYNLQYSNSKICFKET